MPPRVHLAALLLRVGLGALLLTFGLDKFNQPAQVQQQVASSRLLPEAVAPLFASAIGFWEVGLAALLLLGLLTRPAAIAAAAAIASYTVYNGVVAGYPAFGLTTSGVLDRNVALVSWLSRRPHSGAAPSRSTASCAAARSAPASAACPTS